MEGEEKVLERLRFTVIVGMGVGYGIWMTVCKKMTGQLRGEQVRGCNSA